MQPIGARVYKLSVVFYREQNGNNCAFLLLLCQYIHLYFLRWQEGGLQPP